MDREPNYELEVSQGASDKAPSFRTESFTDEESSEDDLHALQVEGYLEFRAKPYEDHLVLTSKGAKFLDDIDKKTSESVAQEDASSSVAQCDDIREVERLARLISKVCGPASVNLSFCSGGNGSWSASSMRKDGYGTTQVEALRDLIEKIACELTDQAKELRAKLTVQEPIRQTKEAS